MSRKKRRGGGGGIVATISEELNDQAVEAFGRFLGDNIESETVQNAYKRLANKVGPQNARRLFTTAIPVVSALPLGAIRYLGGLFGENAITDDVVEILEGIIEGLGNQTRFNLSNLARMQESDVVTGLEELMAGGQGNNNNNSQGGSVARQTYTVVPQAPGFLAALSYEEKDVKGAVRRGLKEPQRRLLGEAFGRLTTAEREEATKATAGVVIPLEELASLTFIHGNPADLAPELLKFLKSKLKTPGLVDEIKAKAAGAVSGKLTPQARQDFGNRVDALTTAQKNQSLVVQTVEARNEADEEALGAWGRFKRNLRLFFS